MEDKEEPRWGIKKEGTRELIKAKGEANISFSGLDLSTTKEVDLNYHE